MQKRCPKCETKKDVSEFYRNKGAYDGLSSYCSECQKQKEADASKTTKRRNQPAQRKRWAEQTVKMLRLDDKDY
jgi:hypothetical protein